MTDVGFTKELLKEAIDDPSDLLVFFASGCLAFFLDSNFDLFIGLESTHAAIIIAFGATVWRKAFVASTRRLLVEFHFKRLKTDATRDGFNEFANTIKDVELRILRRNHISTIEAGERLAQRRREYASLLESKSAAIRQDQPDTVLDLTG